ncbi:MAG: phosphoribosylanthranilate isomerase [bacterium]|nr:phosphoribosylanthranilate isomerase [bacterium]
MEKDLVVKVKICGITCKEDAEAAVNFGADAIGFVFADSPRRITSDKAREIISVLPPFIATVGIFVNEDEKEVRRIASFCGISILQFHGDETPSYCSKFPRVIKAFRIKGREDIKRIREYKAETWLLDTYQEEKPGGTGVTFDWSVACDLAKEKRIILSGGLTPENVASAIKIVSPYAVDVSSGVEEYPGKKDHKKLEEFIRNAKAL